MFAVPYAVQAFLQIPTLLWVIPKLGHAKTVFVSAISASIGWCAPSCAHARAARLLVALRGSAGCRCLLGLMADHTVKSSCFWATVFMTFVILGGGVLASVAFTFFNDKEWGPSFNAALAACFGLGGACVTEVYRNLGFSDAPLSSFLFTLGTINFVGMVAAGAVVAWLVR